ncbi:MAG: hydantoinase/oxoprolinase family protein [Burkholderiales bacterium]|nr:hydantoinase/oxoprolinase family protein [Burkholderiales bacterium]
MMLIGCDVGGTFTDFVFVDSSDGRVSTGKVLTTPADPSEAILAGLQDFARTAGGDFAFADQVVHGTTLGINALLERKGARTGLLVTEGFRDILDIRRCARVDMYDLGGEFPAPLIDRRDRREIRERMSSEGVILAELDEDHARAQVRSLLDQGIESVAVCTLHSYVNPAHEIRIAELVAGIAPQVPVSLSSEVAGEIREFERLATTAIDAYLKPRMHSYLERLDHSLRERGFRGRLYLLLSGGTVVAAKTGKRMPARLVESGPMSGAITARFFAGESGSPDVISYDMGGTSAKACLLRDGKIPITREYEVDRSFRFKRGSGMPLMVPTVDLIEIGAGGGSIARIDELGLLKVGPHSAGAVPGPACYRRGGGEPTVTDANLVLGYLDPDYFLGGQLALDASASRAALRQHIAAPLSIGVLEAAWGVHRVVNESMANAIKTCVAERGGDVRRATMVGFGGAGPVHAAQLARTLKIPKLVIPPFAGVVSALGFLLAPFAYDIVRTHKVPLAELDVDRVRALLAALAEDARRVVAETGSSRPARTERFAELCFIGQGYPVTISLAEFGERAPGVARIRALFLEAYRERYGHCSDDAPVELVSVRVVVSMDPEPLPGRLTAITSAGGDARKAGRDAYDEAAGGLIPHAVYDRYRVSAGMTIEGPALIEERETTTVLPRRARATAREDGALVIEFQR